MGASTSTNAIDVVNSAIISVVTSNVNSCSSSLNQTQNVSYSGTSLFNTASQSATVAVSCLQNIKMTSNLSSSIAQAIQQQASANSIALLPSYAGSNNFVNLKNYISTKLTTNILQSCTAQATQIQNVQYTGIVVGSKATQVLTTLTKCLQNALNKNNIAQGLVQNASQVAKSTSSNPLNFLGNMYMSIAMIILVVVISLIVIGYLLFGHWGKKKTPSQS